MCNYRRVVLKVSGESLADTTALEPGRFAEVAKRIAELHESVAVVVVVGGGNLLRGQQAGLMGMTPTSADVAGMVATGLNVSILRGRLEDEMRLTTRVFGRGPCAGLGETYTPEALQTALARGEVVLLAGGLGVPGISTDVAAVHAAVDGRADAVVMSKFGVDGVYAADPRRFPDAPKLDRLTASDALNRRLEIMDRSALEMARANGVRIHVVPADCPDAVIRAVRGEVVGSVILPG